MDLINKTLSWRVSLEQAILGILTTAIPITFVNASGGVVDALKAGGIQAILTFFTVFINTSIFQYFYSRNQKFFAVAAPTTLTTVLSFLVHVYAGSPEPFWSAFIVFLMAVWFFSLLAFFSKKFKTISVLVLSRICIKKLRGFLRR